MFFPLGINCINFNFLCNSLCKNIGAKKPSVAAIDGLALGGGIDIAMVSIHSLFFYACIIFAEAFKYLSRPIKWSGH